MSRKSLYPDRPILIVDDDEWILEVVEETLSLNGFNNTAHCSDSREVIALLEEIRPAIVLLDLTMPHISGYDLLPQITERYPEVVVIVITGTNEVETAVECMLRGASDYLVKAIEEGHLLRAVRKALEIYELKIENRSLKGSLLGKTSGNVQAFKDILTMDREMYSIFKYLEIIAKTSQPILLIGETGVGKDLFARAVHRISEREGELVEINVAGLDDTLFSDTLFGHRRGAFTGAETDRKGLIEQAGGGSLFLDEIGDLSIQSQIKLLRLIENGEYLPLGADTKKQSRARLILATNRNPRELVESGEFRKDLYYRLSTYEVEIPPLRQRRDDIMLLFKSFLDETTRDYGIEHLTYPRELASLLQSYSFPGNVRELKAMVSRAVSMSRDGELPIEVFESMMENGRVLKPGSNNNSHIIFPDHLPSLKEVDRLLIEEAMRRSGRNQSAAAKLLGISQQALSRRLKEEQKKQG